MSKALVDTSDCASVSMLTHARTLHLASETVTADAKDATYVVMWHEGWGKVKGETFDDFDLARKRFEAFEGGRFAAILVDGRFRELRYYGTRGRWLQHAGCA